MGRRWAAVHRSAIRAGLLVLTDVASSSAAVLATVWILSATASGVQFTGTDLTGFLAAVLLVQPLVLAVCGAYGATANRNELARVLVAVLSAAVLVWVQIRLAGTTGALWSGTGLLVYTLAASATVVGGRTLLGRAVRFAYRRGFGQRRILVIGSAAETAWTMKLLRDESGEDVRIVRRLAPPRRRADHGSLASELPAVLSQCGASEVVIASSELSLDAFDTLIHRCFAVGATVSIAPRFLDRIHAHVELRQAPGGAVLQLHPRGLASAELTRKRIMDVVLSVVGLILLAPLFLLIAAAIRLDSPGPVVFKQLRTGLRGRPFWMYKFRTMVANADEIKPELAHLNASGDARLFKIKDDPRVTTVGRFLRATSLDELPQLMNVLSGEMSLIGPRPFFPEDLGCYADHHFVRLSVLPGITGLWQVSGRSELLDFEEVVRLDREYIDRWSVWLDLKILGLTVPAVLRRTGAY